MALVTADTIRLKHGCTGILYTHPQTIGLYEKLGFRRQKTGFILFAQGPEKLKWFEEVGFLWPEGQRFPDTEAQVATHLPPERTELRTPKNK